MHRPEGKPLDALTQQAKADARRRRSPLVMLLALGLLLSPVALLVWWVAWPSPPPSALVLAGYDQVALPDEPVRLSGQLEAIATVGAEEDLSGHALYFQDGKSDQVLTARTASGGRAAIERRYSASEPPIEMVIRFAGDGPRRGSQARSRLFVWTADTPLLLVDADRTLANAEPGELWTVNNLLLPALPDAAPALRLLREKYQVVYLTAEADRPTRYLKLRAWLERGWASPEQQFPDGPILSPASMRQEVNAPSLVHAVAADLRRRFSGKILGVAERVAEAEAFRSVGVESFLLSEATEVPQGTTVLPSWSALVRRLVGKNLGKVTR